LEESPREKKLSQKREFVMLYLIQHLLLREIRVFRFLVKHEMTVLRQPPWKFIGGSSLPGEAKAKTGKNTSSQFINQRKVKLYH
jgi:hypothetical protein